MNHSHHPRFAFSIGSIIFLRLQYPLTVDMLHYMITSNEIAERMKCEILEDVSAGTVPANVAGYTDLHEYVDANCYGGTEALFDAAHAAAPDTEEAHTSAWNSFCDLVNPAIEAVDAWIESGGIASAIAQRAKR